MSTSEFVGQTLTWPFAQSLRYYKEFIGERRRGVSRRSAYNVSGAASTCAAAARLLGGKMLCRRKCPLFRFLRRKEGGCLFIRALTGTPTWVCRCKSREKGCCVAGSRYPGPAFMAVVNRCAITVLLIEFMNYDILLSVPVVLCTFFFSVYTQPTKANTNKLTYACTRTKRKMDTRCCCFFLWRGICIHRRASFLLVLHKIK